MHIFPWQMVIEIWTKTDELGQVYGYSRRFAEIGVAEVLVNALHEQVAPSSLPSACAALKSIAVNVSFAMLSIFKLFKLQFNWKNNFSGGYPLWQVWDSDLN